MSIQIRLHPMLQNLAGGQEQLTTPVKDGDGIDIVIFVAGDNSKTRLRLHG